MPICLMVPDLISYATQLWRAAEVLPLMWHSLLLKIIGFSLPSHSLSYSLTHTHAFCPCSLWACSVNQPLVRRCWCRVSVPSGGFRQLFSRVVPRLHLKNRFEQPRQRAWERHFNTGQGSFCRLESRLPVSGSGETCGSSGEAYRGSVALPPYQLGRA